MKSKIQIQIQVSAGVLARCVRRCEGWACMRRQGADSFGKGKRAVEEGVVHLPPSCETNAGGVDGSAEQAGCPGHRHQTGTACNLMITDDCFLLVSVAVSEQSHASGKIEQRD